MEEKSKVFTAKLLEDLVEVFSKHNVEYLIIGKTGAIIYGFPDTTQDIDIFPKKSKENGRKVVLALKELGFKIDGRLNQAIVQGKDFIQIRGGPFNLDLIFAPDGIESFEIAKKRACSIEEKYPVASISDIIESKKIASRKKDKEVIERLVSFAKYLKEKRGEVL